MEYCHLDTYISDTQYFRDSASHSDFKLLISYPSITHRPIVRNFTAELYYSHNTFKMQTFTTTALLVLVASIASAALAPQDYNGFEAQITFQGAAGAQFTESVPADGNQYYIGILSYSSQSSLSLTNDR
jgi:hypothetical protein